MIKVYADLRYRNKGIISKSFHGNTTLEKAVKIFATQCGFKNFVVKNDSHEDIPESEGKNRLSKFGDVLIYPEVLCCGPNCTIRVEKGRN